MVKDFLEKIKQYNAEVDVEKISAAFYFVKKKCEDLEIDFEECAELLKFVIELKPDDDTFVAALLLKLYLAEKFTDEQIHENFGQSVLSILSGVKKLQKLSYGSNDTHLQLEIFRKMFMVMAKDVRVVILELVYRLYLMNNLDNLPEKEAAVFAKETLNVYVPIAARMGIYNLKNKLEDLAFKYANREEYEELSKKLGRFGKRQKVAIDYMKKRLEEFLAVYGFRADIEGRFKSTYSIYKKMSRKGFNSIDDLYDVFAMRIILPSKYDESGQEKVDHLYGVLGLIHGEWSPLSKRFKDYVAVPKPNGYQSLHTVVLGLPPKEMDRPVEIQIRSENMHRKSEYGHASHWVYKSTGKSDPSVLQGQIDWLKGLEKLHQDMGGEVDVLKEIDVNIFKDRIFVLTPRGEVKDLPLGATPIDFAYSVHTDVGNRAVGAKVNGQIVSFDHELENGDVVEILTKRDAAPKLQWVSFAKTDFARNKVKAYFGSLNKDHNVKEGKRLLNLHLERLGKPHLDQSYSVLKNYLGRELSLVEREHLVQEVGKGAQAAGDIVKKVFPYEEVLPKKEVVATKAVSEVEKVLGEGADLSQYVLVGGEDGLPVRFASCCKPRYKDKILAYITRGSRMTIHKSQCSLLDSLDRNRIIHASWKSARGEVTEKKYRVGIKITVVSRIGLIRDMSAVISSFGMEIIDIKMEGNKNVNGMHDDHFVLEMSDLNQFDLLLTKLENVRGVVKVVRE